MRSATASRTIATAEPISQAPTMPPVGLAISKKSRATGIAQAPKKSSAIATQSARRRAAASPLRPRGEDDGRS